MLWTLARKELLSNRLTLRLAVALAFSIILLETYVAFFFALCPSTAWTSRAMSRVWLYLPTDPRHHLARGANRHENHTVIHSVGDAALGELTAEITHLSFVVSELALSIASCIAVRAV